MNPTFLRRLAQRCLDLVRSARSGTTREQLQIWAREFEDEAMAVERHNGRADLAVRPASDAAASEGTAPA